MYHAYGWHTVPLTVEVIPEQVRPWLTYQGNLTAQLKQQTSPHRLSLWRQGLESIPIHEQLLLRQTLPGMAWVRQIYHVLGNDVVMYGRTVIPEAIYIQHQDILDNLGTKSIGEHFLYDQAWKRSPFMYGCVTPAGILHEAATQGGQSRQGQDFRDTILSARRSTFAAGTGLILLTEVFLPTIATYNTQVESVAMA